MKKVIKKKVVKKKKKRKLIERKNMTQVIIDKITAALSPLYTDPDFAEVTDMNVAVSSQVVPPPAPTVDQIDVVKPA